MKTFLIEATIATLAALAVCYLIDGWPALVGGLLGVPVAFTIIAFHYRRKHGTK